MQELKEGLNISLPKWPALVVRGTPVTKEQAKEILIRTDTLDFSTNDHSFARQLFEFTYGVKAKKEMYHISLYNFFEDDNNKVEWEVVEALRRKTHESLKVLNLDYLANHRIVSAWVGGPHGWCDWDGYIGCNNYNIGKYPTMEEVFNEWYQIAEAFPFLELDCQLLSGETCTEFREQKPLVNFHIEEGQVQVGVPLQHSGNILDYPRFDINAAINAIAAGTAYRERGCTFEQYVEAHDYVLNKYRETKKE